MSSSIRVGILTVSDAGFRGARQDLSGPALQSICQEKGWPVVVTEMVPDQFDLIADRLREWADSARATLILTTGGTGIAPRDVTPEATRAVLQRELSGVAELMRVRGLEQTAFSVLSRAAAGTRGQTLIVNLPGSPAGAAFSLLAIEHLIPHSIALLAGETEHSTSPETQLP